MASAPRSIPQPGAFSPTCHQVDRLSVNLQLSAMTKYSLYALHAGVCAALLAPPPVSVPHNCVRAVRVPFASL